MSDVGSILITSEEFLFKFDLATIHFLPSGWDEVFDYNIVIYLVILNEILSLNYGP